MKDVDEESATRPGEANRTRLESLLGQLRHDPQNQELRRDAISAACDTQQWLVAHELLEAGLQAHPGDTNLLAHARRLEPAEVRYHLARALHLQRHSEKAFRQLQSPLVVLEIPHARVLRARCLHHLQRRVEAIADCRAHLALQPEDPEANGLMALLLYERDQRGAVRHYVDCALNSIPTQCEALLALAYLQLDARQERQAFLTLKRLLGAHPDCGPAWLGLALIELGALQLEAARCNVLLALKFTPQHIGTWHTFAWVEIMTGNVADAERAFQQALALDRNSGESHGGLAIIAALRGAEDEARRGVKRALTLDFDSLLARYAETLLLEQAGCEREARDALAQILTRPAPRGELTYRDLVVRKLMHARAQRSASPGRE